MSSLLRGGWWGMGGCSFEEIKRINTKAKPCQKASVQTLGQKLNKSSMIEYFPSFNTNKPALCWLTHHGGWSLWAPYFTKSLPGGQLPLLSSKGLRIMFPMLLV